MGGINTDQCLTISADADNTEAQDLVCPDGTVVTEVVDGHSGAAYGIQKVASVVCCALDVISQPSSAPSLSPTTTEPTYAPSPSPTTAPSQAPTSTACCLLALFKCNPPLSD